MDKDWAPFGKTIDANDTLVEGIPVWIRVPVQNWIAAASETIGVWTNQEWQDQAAEFDRLYRNRNPFSLTRYVWHDLGARDDATLTLAYVDFLVAKLGGTSDDTRLGELETLLEEGGSALRVGLRGNHAGLEARVATGTHAAADMVMTSSGDAGDLLYEAWRAAYGRLPDPEEAYEKAIKAVEQAGASVVVPANTKATLGTMIPTLRAQKDWGLSLADKAGEHSYSLIADMCDVLWQGQPSRHGANGYRKPTQDEAEAAVLLAVPLVQWFVSGQILRRT